MLITNIKVTRAKNGEIIDLFNLTYDLILGSANVSLSQKYNVLTGYNYAHSTKDVFTPSTITLTVYSQDIANLEKLKNLMRDEGGVILTFTKNNKERLVWCDWLNDNINHDFHFVDLEAVTFALETRTWFIEPKTYSFDVNSPGSGDVYPYTYPLIYSSGSRGNINSYVVPIDVEGNTNATFLISMGGLSTNPKFYLDEEDSTSSYVSTPDVIVPANKELVISSFPKDSYIELDGINYNLKREFAGHKSYFEIPTGAHDLIFKNVPRASITILQNFKGL